MLLDLLRYLAGKIGSRVGSREYEATGVLKQADSISLWIHDNCVVSNVRECDGIADTVSSGNI